MKKPYLREYQKITKLIILISIAINLVSVYLDFFVLHNSLLLTLGDVTLLATLTLVYVFFERFLDSFFVRRWIFAVFPLVYFPMAWLGSSGNHQIGVIYFFLFSSVMMFINPGKIGFLAILALLLEMMVLVAWGNSTLNGPGFEWEYLLHLGIVGIANTFIMYSIIVKNNLLSQTFYHNSNRDFLTGSYNRRYLNEHFASLDESGNYGVSTCLFFCDLDDFKMINDSHGHETGDRVLKLFGDVITSQIRSQDLFGRFGGDEFVILVNNLKADDALGFQSRIIDQFSNQARQQFGFEVAVSIGFAMVDQSIEKAMDQADKAMYQSKNKKKALEF